MTQTVSPISRRNALACIAGAAALPNAHAPVPTNVTLEISLEAERRHPDPFHQVVLDVLFTDPAGRTRTVPAFWAGGRQWKARYASPLPGTHTWISRCTDRTDDGLHGRSGEVELVPYRGENPLYRHGPLRAAAGRRHLEHLDGTPFLWLGDTWWMGLCHRLTFPEEFARLTADRVAKGFNVVQLVAGLYPDMFPFDPRGANEAGFPWETDYARIRPEYFNAADDRIRHLVENGISPCIVGAWGYFIQWMGAEKLCAHWRYLIARWGSMPVTWCTAGEANLPWYQASNFPSDDRAQVKEWTKVIRYLRSTDPFRRPLTIHPTAISRYTARNATEDENLLDWDMLQTPHGQREAVATTVKAVRDSVTAKPVMPVINGEAAYEKLMDRIGSEWTRAMFWLCMTNGAKGHTYGANGIWQLNRPGRPHGPSPTKGSPPPTKGSPPTGYGTITWEEAMRLPGSTHMGIGRRLFASLPWTKLEPVFGGAVWDEEAAADTLTGPQTCGIGDRLRIVYALDPKSVRMLGLRPAARYRVRLFDPVTGDRTAAEAKLSTPQGELVVPPPSHGHDWVILAERG
jgi:hypothetical protein